MSVIIEDEANLNLNQNTISRYENLEREADYDTLIKLANYFDVSIDYLLCRVNTNLSNDAKRQNLINKIQEELEELKKY